MPRQVTINLPATNAVCGFAQGIGASGANWPNAGAFLPIGTTPQDVIDTNTGSIILNPPADPSTSPVVLPYLTADHQGIRTQDWYGLTGASPPVAGGAIASSAFWDFTFPANYDPDYPVCLEYTYFGVSVSGDDVLLNGAYNYGSMLWKIIQYNGEKVSTNGSPVLPPGDIRSQNTPGYAIVNFPTWDETNDHKTQFIEDFQQTVQIGGGFGAPTSTIPYAGGMTASLSVFFNTGTKYPNTFVGTPDLSHIEIRDVRLIFNCGGDTAVITSQGHIF